jgi:hypothetical protein
MVISLVLPDSSQSWWPSGMLFFLPEKENEGISYQV